MKAQNKIFKELAINPKAKRATVDIKARFNSLKKVRKVLTSEKIDQLIQGLTVVACFGLSWFAYELFELTFFSLFFNKFGFSYPILFILTGALIWWVKLKKLRNIILIAKFFGVILFFITIPVSGLLNLFFNLKAGGVVGDNLVNVILQVKNTHEIQLSLKIILFVIITAGIHILRPVMSVLILETRRLIYKTNNLIEPKLDLDKELAKINVVEPQAPAKKQSQSFSDILKSCGIENTKVVEVNDGHRLTEYLVRLPSDINPSVFDSKKLISLGSNLGVNGIGFDPIVEGMPKTVSVTVPKLKPENVSYLEGINSDEFKNCNCELPMLVGANTKRKYVVLDLAAMPHILMAGRTGGGKSKSIIAMLLSLLKTVSPEKLRLSIIDPKIIEMVQFSKVPHLEGAGILTDPVNSLDELRKATVEMDARYNLMRDRAILTGKSIKNMKAYNESLKGTDIPKLKYWVIIVDEFADLGMMADKELLEKYITRLGQKSRAAGIHLALLTQKPTADNISTSIKSNLPCRIALSVSSNIDSRTILDESGAELLLGKGDMLIAHASLGMGLTRVHAAYVDDNLEDELLSEWD